VTSITFDGTSLTLKELKVKYLGLKSRAERTSKELSLWNIGSGKCTREAME